MIFVWWISGALTLFLLLFVIAVSAGIEVQLSADLSQGYAVASISVLSLLVLRFRAFESDGRLYCQLNGGRLHHITGKRDGKSGKKKSAVHDGQQRRRGKLKLRALTVNASAGLENASDTAVVNSCLTELIIYLINRFVSVKRGGVCVNPAYDVKGMKINVFAVAGWGSLFSLRSAISGRKVKRLAR